MADRKQGAGLMNHGKWICQNKRFIEQQLDYFFHLLASVFYLLYINRGQMPA